MKSISKQLICISIMTLLVGVSYTSAIRVDNKIPILDNQGEHDCGCNDVSAADIIKLEKQLNNLERNNKLLLELSKDFPIVKRKIEKLHSIPGFFSRDLGLQFFQHNYYLLPLLKCIFERCGMFVYASISVHIIRNHVIVVLKPCCVE